MDRTAIDNNAAAFNNSSPNRGRMQLPNLSNKEAIQQFIRTPNNGASQQVIGMLSRLRDLLAKGTNSAQDAQSIAQLQQQIRNAAGSNGTIPEIIIPGAPVPGSQQQSSGVDWDAKIAKISLLSGMSGADPRVSELRRLYVQGKAGNNNEDDAARIDELEKQLGLGSGPDLVPGGNKTKKPPNSILEGISKGISNAAPRVIGALADSMIGAIRNPAGQEAPTSAVLQASADHMREEAAREEESAQKSAQIANRNDFAEADRIAAGQALSQFGQGVAMTGGQAGAAAAALANAKTVTPDVQAVQERQDRERQEAFRKQQEADSSRLSAYATDLARVADNAEYRDMGGYNAAQRAVTQGGTPSTPTTTQTPPINPNPTTPNPTTPNPTTPGGGLQPPVPNTTPTKEDFDRAEVAIGESSLSPEKREALKNEITDALVAYRAGKTALWKTLYDRSVNGDLKGVLKIPLNEFPEWSRIPGTAEYQQYDTNTWKPTDVIGVRGADGKIVPKDSAQPSASSVTPSAQQQQSNAFALSMNADNKARLLLKTGLAEGKILTLEDIAKINNVIDALKQEGRLPDTAGHVPTTWEGKPLTFNITSDMQLKTIGKRYGSILQNTDRRFMN